MSTDLREELTALAETQTFHPDPSAWDRGRRARRNSRIVRGAAIAAVVAIVVGVGAIAVRPERAPVQPAGEVRGGALPSRVHYAPGDFEDDWAIGRASVAMGGNGLVLIGAEDGRSHHFAVAVDVLALSPDGYRVAWWSGQDIRYDGIRIADLRTGEVTEVVDTVEDASVASMTWAPDSGRLRWNGWGDQGARVAAWIDTDGSTDVIDEGQFGARGVLSPGLDVVALGSDGEVAAAPFETAPDGDPVDRALPTDLYPDGAVVTPVGWADEDTVVAIVDPPPSDVTEHPRLALLSAPGVPDDEVVVREFLPRLPPEATSFAVDLIPDLTGDPDQELTRDFTATQVSSDGSSRVPVVAGGVMALLVGIAFIRMMHTRA